MDSELEQERGRRLNASSESYFDDNEGRFSDSANRPKTYTQMFESVFPQYLALGMTYELFWFGDCTLVKAYREAHRLKFEQSNLYAWLQGAYIYEAIALIAPAVKSPFNKVRKLQPYVSKPHEFIPKKITSKERKEIRKKEDQAFFDVMNNWMTMVNADIAAKNSKEKEKLTQESAVEQSPDGIAVPDMGETTE